ncbi:hypothetical protein GAYE_SCF39G5302 [Galdieria yellowstonensis]|uniref:Cyclin-dependent kinase inhibitor domain-containing protein n=1 Tax=Galdieria yellowstonensis TaxID=3028027 RepID=A0AAV9IIU5_9RHOD|nr:hypothetical protein GAYE_SCF39G5302 [Galdieria yellowstonensis]
MSRSAGEAQDDTPLDSFPNKDIPTNDQQQVKSNRRKRCSTHHLWLRRVRRLLFPEADEYMEAILYQVPLWEEEDEETEDAKRSSTESVPEELLNLLQQLRQKKVEEFKARWNFDPVTHTPLEGRWKWTELSEQ